LLWKQVHKDWLNAMSSVPFTSLALLTAWLFVGQDHMLRHALLLVAMQKLALALFEYQLIFILLSRPLAILFISSASCGFGGKSLESLQWLIRILIITTPSSWVTPTSHVQLQSS
jgi:hypothetical protein